MLHIHNLKFFPKREKCVNYFKNKGINEFNFSTSQNTGKTFFMEPPEHLKNKMVWFAYSLLESNHQIFFVVASKDHVLWNISFSTYFSAAWYGHKFSRIRQKSKNKLHRLKIWFRRFSYLLLQTSYTFRSKENSLVSNPSHIFT